MPERLASDSNELHEVQKGFFGGSRAAMLRILSAIPIYLLLTPFTLKYLHAEQFAIWSFNATIIGIISLADLGLKSSLSFYSAQNLRNPERLQKLLGTGLCVYVALWASLTILTVVFLHDLVSLMNVPAPMERAASFVVLVTVIGFGMRFVAMPFQAVIETHQGVAFTQYVLLFWLLANAVAIFIFLPHYPSLYVMGWISVAGNAIVLLAFYRHLVRSFPYLRLSALSFDLRAAKALSKYGLGVYLGAIMISLREPLYKIFLSKHFGLALVTDFEVCFRLCTQLISAVISPLLGTFVAAAVLASRPSDLAIMLRPSIGFALLVLIPLTLCTISFSPWLVAYWLGPNNHLVVAMLPWMFAAFATYYATEVMYQALLAAGESRFSGAVQTVTLATCALILFLLKDLPPELDVGISISAGFFVFTSSTLVRFRRRFPKLELFRASELVRFALPSVIYLVLSLSYRDNPTALALLFFAYIAIHVWVARVVGIIDLFAFVRRLLPRPATS